ncbi:MAG: ATP-binding protein [Methylocystis silviterrae]|uniref:ATP-binding protein n=1 Tax=Methylocystis silviterrae TaxID=2743612 RepID=UPI003C772A98
MALAELQFIDRAQAVHLIGTPPAQAIPISAWHSAWRRLKPAAASTSPASPTSSQHWPRPNAKGAAGENPLLYRFSLLIVDEIGYLPVTPGGGHLFFQLVNVRYEKGA